MTAYVFNRNKIQRLIKECDILIFFSSLVIGFEYLPLYLGLDLQGFTLAWIFLPIFIFISIKNNMNIYLKSNLKIVAILLFYPLLFSISYGFDDFSISYIRSFVTSIMVFSLFYIHGKSVKGLRSFVIGMIIIGTFAVIITIYEGPVNYPELVHEGIRISPLGDPNISNIYVIGLASSFPIWIALIKPIKGFMLGIIVYILSIYTVILTLSRGGFIAMTFCAFFIVVLYYHKNRLQPIHLAGLLFVSCALLFVLSNYEINTPDFTNNLLNRFNIIKMTGIGSSTLGGRVFSMKWFIHDLFTSPNLLGIGYSKYSNLYSFRAGYAYLPHNTFIDSYIIFGIVGFIVYLVLWYRALSAYKYLFKSNLFKNDSFLKSSFMWAFCFGATLAILLNSLSIFWTKIIWAYLGLGCGLYEVFCFKKHKVQNL